MKNITLCVSLLISACEVEPINSLELESNVFAWQNIYGLDKAALPGVLRKVATNGWGNAGASSMEVLTGDGLVQFRSNETTLGKSLGLSNGDSTQSFTDIDFSIHLSGNGSVYVYENGINRGNFGLYNPSDEFRVQVIGGGSQVQYVRNWVPFYTSTHAPSFPLLIDTALYHTGATLVDIQLAQ